MAVADCCRPMRRLRWRGPGARREAPAPSRAVLLLAVGCLAGCGATGSASNAGPTAGGGSGGAKGGFNPGAGTGGASAGSTSDAGIVNPDAPVLPPEQEVDSSFQVPVATGRYVWVANPTSGRVAYVDATTVSVKTVEAGNAPTYLATVPGATDEVIVLNALSHDATLMQAAPTGLVSTMIPGLAPLANAWAVSADGHFALAWTDSRAALAAGTHDTLEGFQQLTAIDLRTAPTLATTLAVGYRPVSITFAADASEAYVVTGDGVSVIGLPGAGGGAVRVTRDVPLTDDPLEDADTRDVSVTATGTAVVRREGSADVRIVDLHTSAAGVVTLSGPVTDLDVTPDGTRAVAVVRATSQVAVLPLATAVSQPTTIASETIAEQLVGSVVITPDGAQAILYSNAAETETLVVVNLASGTYRQVRVHALVLSVVPTPDGQFAIVLHRQPSPTTGTGGSGGASPSDGGVKPADGGVADAGSAPLLANAFSVIPLDGTRAGRIQETTAPPGAVAWAPGSDHALITVSDQKMHIYGAYLVGVPALDVTSIALASPPIATGVVAGANRGYVAQSYSEGRITFIPFDQGPPQTLTGFDLGARVVDGVSP